MEIQDESTNCDALELCDLSSDQRLDRTGNPDPDGLIRWPKLSSVPGPRSGASHCFDDSSVAGTDLKKSQDRARGKRVLRITLSEFVESRFIPGYVVERRAAGRAHFRAILKHILTPEAVDAAFAISSGASSRTLKTASHWPYLGSVRLGDVTSEMIQHLTATALQQGYSIQTATHIRNVIRTVFSYAVQTGCHVGTNPAAAVRLPALAHSNRHALTCFLASLPK